MHRLSAPPPPARLPALLLVLLAPLLFGCEEDVLLVEETGRAYTLFGILNPQADTQFVHVFPVEGSLAPAPAAPFAGRFTSVDDATGETRVWADSLVRDAQGQYGHVFWAPFRVGYERVYRLRAEGDDGRASEVTVAVPPRVRPFEDPARPTPGAVLTPLRLDGHAPGLLRLHVTFWVRTIEGYVDRVPVYAFREVTVPYGTRFQPTAAGGLVPINLTEGFRAAYTRLVLDFSPELLAREGIDLLLITVDVIVANAAWQPPGGPDAAFDPLALAHPTVLTNVENGFGFVGAGYRIRHQWRPPTDALVAAGFVPPR